LYSFLKITMHTTPNRKTNPFYSANQSAFMEPFFFETPRVRRFYEKNSDLSDEKSGFDAHKLFTLMESPHDFPSLAKKNFLMLKNIDIFSEGFDFCRTSEKKSRDDVADYLPQPNKYLSIIKNIDVQAEAEAEQGHQEQHISYEAQKVEMSKNHEHQDHHDHHDHHDNDNSTTVCSRLMSDLKAPELVEQHFEEADDNDNDNDNDGYSDQVVKFAFDGKDGEIRKRKRKTTSQLKILQAEFDKDDNWDKEKITLVAKITGLSESQVYKWCWDQKKKTDGCPKEKSKFDFEDKENICPRENSNILAQSKQILKMKKKTKPFNQVSVSHQYTMSPEFFAGFEDNNFVGLHNRFNL